MKSDSAGGEQQGELHVYRGQDQHAESQPDPGAGLLFAVNLPQNVGGEKYAGVQDVAQSDGQAEQADELHHLEIADDDVHHDEGVQPDPPEEAENHQGRGEIHQQENHPQHFVVHKKIKRHFLSFPFVRILVARPPAEAAPG